MPYPCEIYMEDAFKNNVKKILFGIKNKFIDKEAIDKFHKVYYNSGVWQFTEWEGIRIYKYPSDLFLYQEIIFKNKPDLILETGTLYGGSALFFARLFDILGKGKVISIDNIERKLPKHKRIKYIVSNSIEDFLISKLRMECKDNKVMVVLDSDHHKEHVLKEMKLYGKLVSKGQYLIVEDGDIHLVYPSFGEGPFEAIEEFLRDNKDFKIDKKIENKYLFTANPNGFLIRK